MSGKIIQTNFCPSCKSELSDNNKLAQGVKECKICKSKWFIILTSVCQEK